MTSLFGRNKLEEVAKSIATEDIAEFVELVKAWHTDYHKGSLKKDKETSREQQYNRDFFLTILGYEEKPASPFSFEPKATTEKGQLPDAVLSYTEGEEANIAAVIELKAASIELDRPQRRDGNLSPVQQGFKYKTQYRNCPFVVVSNFWEFRLYHDNLLDYERWTLDDLVDPSDDYLAFKTWYVLMTKENLTAAKGVSKTQELLTDIRVEQEEIGKSFYKVYKEARLELLRDLYRENGRVREDIDFGIENAQKIIDRLIFAAFAEDRGLLPDNTLHRVLQYASDSAFDGSLWGTLKNFFGAVDTGSEKLEIPNGYNGGLFKDDPDLNNLKISDEPLRMVAELGKYDFAEDLSVNILGHIFEQSISDLEEIKDKVNQANNLDTIGTSKRKKDGIFYTPDYLVRYIVDNSLGQYLREHEEKFKEEANLKGDITDKTYAKREKQAYTKYQDFLQQVKVVDPACGSGAFLVHVFDYLLAENQRVGDILGNTLLSTDAYVKDILRNNIYGVDLNEESVEITKLSLWLKTAQKGKKLTALDNNIKCGNSLIDDPEIADDRSFNWHAAFPEIFKNGGFDVVVGNPPYVRQELLGAQKEHFEKHYKVYSGTTDLFAYFYEKGMEILKPNGLLGYISNTFTKTTGAGQVLRNYLASETKFEQFIDFNTLTVFQGATTYPVILVLRNNPELANFDYLYVEKEDLNSLDAAFTSRSFKVEQNTLDDKGWSFESGEHRQLRAKLSLHSSTKEVVGKSYRGILTGFNEAFIIDAETKERLIAEHPSSAELIKPFWEGRDIKRWRSFEQGKFVIYVSQGFTQKKLNETGLEAGESAFRRTFPAIYRHLQPHIGRLKRRHDQGDHFWEMRACAYENLFKDPKITWTNLQNRGKFCIDKSGKYINAPAVILPTEDKALLGLLNSSVVWFFLSGIAVQRSGGYLEIKPQYFEQIPVPKRTPMWNSKVEKLVDQILDLTTKHHQTNKRFERLCSGEHPVNFGKRSLQEWWNLDFSTFVKNGNLKINLDQKDELLTVFEKYASELQSVDAAIQQLEENIDKLVFELYELSQDEVSLLTS